MMIFWNISGMGAIEDKILHLKRIGNE